MRGNVRPFTINGRFLTQSITGVQRYAHEIVRGIDQILAENENASLKGTIIVRQMLPPIIDCPQYLFNPRRRPRELLGSSLSCLFISVVLF